MAIHVELERLPSDDVQRLIDEGLDIFNAEKAGPDNAEDLWVIARDSGGHVQGGLKGRTFYSWLFIDWLWLSPAARGQGVGIRLLNRAEKAAQERGCIGAYVDTFSFQAPDSIATTVTKNSVGLRDFLLAMLASGSKRHSTCRGIPKF